jgi:hypothetical protein
MRAIQIIEARSNPALNIGGKIGSTFSDISDFYDDDTYVSLTALPKLGFNPLSSYSTPLGVYAYPLGDKTIQDQLETETLPFAGKQPYINVLRAQVDVVDLRWDFKYFAYLSDLYDAYLLKHLRINLPSDANLEKDRKKVINDIRVTAEDSAKIKSAGGMWWNHGRVAALLLTRQRSPSYLFPDEIDDIVRNQTHIPGSHAMWTKIMLAIGVKAVVDHGRGIIHSNERTQAVFLSPDAFKILTRVSNPHNDANKTLVVKTAYDFSRLLARTNYSINCRVVSKLFLNAVMGWAYRDHVSFYRDNKYDTILVQMEQGQQTDVLGWARVMKKSFARMTHFDLNRFARLLMSTFPDTEDDPHGKLYAAVMRAMIPADLLAEVRDKAAMESFDSY